MIVRKVLVTGGAGYVGSVIVRDLLRSGYEVKVIDSLLHGGNALLGFYADEKFEFVCGDIRDEKVVLSVLSDVDAVVHLAAIVGDPACARQPEESRTVNLEASIRLFQISQEQGVNRFVFASTCSNYGKMADPSQFVDENSELRPVSLYAEHKVTAEKYLLDNSCYESTNATILRLATAFGLSPRMRFDLTVNEFTMELLINRTLMIYGEQFWRPYVHVNDIANAVKLVLGESLEKTSSRVFNVGDNNQNFRKGEIVDLVRNVIDIECEIEFVTKEEDPRDYRVSFDRISNELGFSIKKTVESGIIEIADVINKGVITDFTNKYYRN